MRNGLVLLAASCALASAAPSAAQTAEVQDLGHGIYRAAGVMGGTAVRVPQSNTFMIVTRDGNVVVDTSIAAAAPAHKRALTAANGGPIKAIILTHAHGDHTGGVALWKQPATEIIAQRAGGPDAVAARARQLVDSDALQALYLTDMALAVDARHRAALEARLAALRWLDAHSGNSNERGWLAAGIRDAEGRLKP
jgi:glyoxylase-like metal-dependent hydrolase (beta-lactamase superfamily II)